MFSRHQKALAVLIDPEDTMPGASMTQLMEVVNACGAAYVFVGGSLVTHNHTDALVRAVKQQTDKPVILFPGGLNQLSSRADGILFLSLISGRNPEFLIGKQVAAAPLLKEMNLPAIPTGYLLIGEASSASYMSNTQPIPYDKTDIAVATALAGEMLGHRVIYLDAGSGAPQPVPAAMISAVRQAVKAPLIVGGGIRSFDAAYATLEAGADVIVVGNAAESNPTVLNDIAGAIKAFNSLNIHK